MPTRPTPLRVRLLTAVLTATAALTLTACNDGQGLRDEGPSSTGAKPAAAGQHPKGARDPVDMRLRRGARPATTTPHRTDNLPRHRQRSFNAASVAQ
ncbi:hypothetical protein [Streptomyces griseoruber]|uniref:hypothetical protein n=1 Tax=Streptomyces griseoruber TaxID=1943 RepID=UPI00099E61D1|nr:hypothetical protein [Streptomyces griseoruber]